MAGFAKKAADSAKGTPSVQQTIDQAAKNLKDTAPPDPTKPPRLRSHRERRAQAVRPSDTMMQQAKKAEGSAMW